MLTSRSAPSTTSVARVRLPQDAGAVLAVLSSHFEGTPTAVVVVDCPDGGTAVEVYFCSPPDVPALTSLLADCFGDAAAGDLTFETLTDTDWVATGLASLTPVLAGRFTVHGSHNRGRAAVNRLAIEIAAAQAFGTGHHGSTRGCLLAMTRLLKSSRRPRVFDLGTGTAVLAIAAAKALHRPVIAADIDPEAVAIARANSARNGVQPLVAVLHTGNVRMARLRQRGPFDLVVANLVLESLVSLSRPLSTLLAPKARVVLSGLLPRHARPAIAAYRRCGLVLEHRLLIEGWVTLTMARPQHRRCSSARR
jgi:ribosomal protein L11 methyltransferase